jgi:competence protein ComEA
MAFARSSLGPVILVAILAAITVAARLQERETRDVGTPRAARAAPLFCAGVTAAGSAPGIACAASREELLAEAVRSGLAPAPCAAAALPPRAVPGRLYVLEAKGGGCAVAAVARLPAATALLCGAKVDLNAASEEELALLPGIGEVRARRIAESRRADGAFPDVESLDRVFGIGPKTVERLRPWLAVEAE